LRGGSLPSLESTSFTAVREARGTVVVEQLRRGELDVGFAFANVTHSGFHGHADESGDDAIGRIGGIAVLPPAALHLLIPRGSNIQSLQDLRGRRIGMGVPSSGTAMIVALLLKAANLDLSLVQAIPIGGAEATQEVLNGNLDAAFHAAIIPAPLVEDATRSGIRLLPIAGSFVDRLLSEVPFIRAMIIPGETYSSQPNVIRTIGTDSLMICRRDLDDDIVYALTKRFYEMLPAFAAKYRGLRSLDLSRVSAMPIPLHPGAARYYRIKELAQ
jgi:TRAP transporter TAXI family solute receptor